jgi:hypothetical protein
MRQAFGQVCIAAVFQPALAAIHLNLETALQYIDETLCRCITEFAARFEFSRVLRKLRSHCRTHMHNGRARFHARQGRANKSVRS